MTLCHIMPKRRGWVNSTVRMVFSFEMGDYFVTAGIVRNQSLVCLDKQVLVNYNYTMFNYYWVIWLFVVWMMLFTDWDILATNSESMEYLTFISFLKAFVNQNLDHLILWRVSNSTFFCVYEDLMKQLALKGLITA